MTAVYSWHDTQCLRDKQCLRDPASAALSNDARAWAVALCLAAGFAYAFLLAPKALRDPDPSSLKAPIGLMPVTTGLRASAASLASIAPRLPLIVWRAQGDIPGEASGTPSLHAIGALFNQRDLSPRRKRGRKRNALVLLRDQAGFENWMAISPPAETIGIMALDATSPEFWTLSLRAEPQNQGLAGKKLALGSLSKTLAEPENRKTALLGVGHDALSFDDRPGRLSTAAEAGRWNGQPATAIGVGYTLPNGVARIIASGVMNTTAVSAISKTFGVSAMANIAFD